MATSTAAGKKENQNNPRIYVASLSDYNSGRLWGVWLDSVDADEVHEGIAAMLKASPEEHSEEVAVHDSEGFGSYNVHEFDSVELLCAIGNAIQEHGTLFADYLGHRGAPKDADEVADAVREFEEQYQGSFRSLEDWAEQFLEDTGSLKEVPESLRPYIDVEKWARDAELGGDIFSIDGDGGEVHVFWTS